MEKKKVLNWLMIFGVFVVYILLAFKNPFKLNNLISNLEPGPDAFYYSVPAWNFVHGLGFKMGTFGVEIPKVVPPIYGVFLAPFFYIFNDVRSYYYANISLGILSILTFYIISKKLFNSLLISLWLLFVLVTNFYFYTVPSVMMAENILTLFTLLSFLLIISQRSKFKSIFEILVICVLLFIKISAYPIAIILTFDLLRNIDYSKFKKYWLILFILSCLFIRTFVYFVLIPNWNTLINLQSAFSLDSARTNIPIMLSQFLGINGSYLWYRNQQIEQIIAVLSLSGLVFSLINKKFRYFGVNFIIASLLVVLLHGSMFYLEGRYVSTLIPIYILLGGVILSQIKNLYFKTFIIFCLFLAYLLFRGDYEGFHERKITSLKRQFLNNLMVENQVPWNYKAVLKFNSFFESKRDGTYLVTFLSPFYINYFYNENYNYLPGSMGQDMMSDGRGFGDKYFPNGSKENLIEYYKKLLNEGKHLYLSNFYVNSSRRWERDLETIKNNFRLELVDEGCYGWCNIYELNQKL